MKKRLVTTLFALTMVLSLSSNVFANAQSFSSGQNPDDVILPCFQANCGGGTKPPPKPPICIPVPGGGQICDY